LSQLVVLSSDGIRLGGPKEWSVMVLICLLGTSSYL